MLCCVTMILKEPDDKRAQILELEALLSEAPATTKSKIEDTLKKLKSGISGENKTRFYLNDYFSKSQNCFLIHDLRIECDGRIAQIDHLLINRLLDIYVIETKQLHAGLKINENGEFSRWNKFAKSYEGMPSPFAQNQRHIDLLKDLFERFIAMPSRLGFTLQPRFRSRVLVNPDARIDRPKRFDTSDLMKSDEFCNHYSKEYDTINFIDVFSSLAKVCTPDQVKSIAMQLISMHKPITPDYRAQFGLSKTTAYDTNIQEEPTKNDAETIKPSMIEQPLANYSVHVCNKCQSQHLSIEYGKYGYYFKCKDCQGNTAIKISCDNAAHKPRLRKDGHQFFKECAECQSSQLFYTNL